DGGVTETRLDHVYVNRPAIRVGAGWLALYGQEGPPIVAANMVLYKVTGNSVTESPIGNYFVKYYVRNATSGYTAPNSCGIDPTTMGDVAFYSTGGHTYLFVAAYGLGDLYELRSGDSVAGSVKKVGATINPNAVLSGAGPYYGDK